MIQNIIINFNLKCLDIYNNMLIYLLIIHNKIHNPNILYVVDIFLCLLNLISNFFF